MSFLSFWQFRLNFNLVDTPCSASSICIYLAVTKHFLPMIIIRCLFRALVCYHFSKKRKLVMESQPRAKFVIVLYADRFKGRIRDPRETSRRDPCNPCILIGPISAPVFWQIARLWEALSVVLKHLMMYERVWLINSNVSHRVIPIHQVVQFMSGKHTERASLLFSSGEMNTVCPFLLKDSHQLLSTWWKTARV